MSSQLDFTVSQPLLWAQLVGAGIDPLSVQQSLGFEYTQGNGISGGSIGFEAQVELENGEVVSVVRVFGTNSGLN